MEKQQVKNEEQQSEFTDKFIDQFVPMINEMRNKKDEKGLGLTMNECLSILRKNLREYLS